MSFSCNQAKANFRMNIYYSSWENNYCNVYNSLPIQECQGSKKESKLLNKINNCMREGGLPYNSKENFKKCEPLMREFNEKYCFTKEVDIETQKIIDYLDNI